MRADQAPPGAISAEPVEIFANMGSHSQDAAVQRWLLGVAEEDDVCMDSLLPPAEEFLPCLLGTKQDRRCSLAVLGGENRTLSVPGQSLLESLRILVAGSQNLLFKTLSQMIHVAARLNYGFV